MIEFLNISKDYVGEPILDGVSFQIQPGERVSLIGPGGCGKSTILKILLGLTPVSDGIARVLGTDMQSASEEDCNIALRRMGIAFQQGGLFDFMTVEQNLQFAMRKLTDKNDEEIADKIQELLRGVKLSQAGAKFPYELSGGMQRRVGIARALCNDPKAAFFDEPTAGLDPVTSTIILNMILDLARQFPETSMMVCTSNVEIAIRFARRIIIIHQAKVVADGSWEELLLRGPDWVRHFLSVRLIGLDREYVEQLNLPAEFIAAHWSH